MNSPRFHVTYRGTPDDSRPIEAHAKDICIEETVEIPEDCVPKGHWDAGIVGIVEQITERPGSPITMCGSAIAPTLRMMPSQTC